MPSALCAAAQSWGHRFARPRRHGGLQKFDGLFQIVGGHPARAGDVKGAEASGKFRLQALTRDGKRPCLDLWLEREHAFAEAYLLLRIAGLLPSLISASQIGGALLLSKHVLLRLSGPNRDAEGHDEHE